MSLFPIQPWQLVEQNWLRSEAEHPSQIVSLKKLGRINLKAQKKQKKRKDIKSMERWSEMDGKSSDFSIIKVNKGRVQRQASTKRVEFHQNITKLNFFKDEKQKQPSMTKFQMKSKAKHNIGSAKNLITQKTAFDTFYRNDPISSKSIISNKSISKYNKTENTSPKDENNERKKLYGKICTKRQLINTFLNKNVMRETFNKELSIQRKIYLLKTGGLEKFNREKQKVKPSLDNSKQKKQKTLKNLVGKIYRSDKNGSNNPDERLSQFF